MHSCIRCREHWFDIKKNSLGVCSRCISRDRERTADEPYFFSATNSLNFGEVPGNLPSLTMVEEMLIARVHVHVKVLQVRGSQYKYRGHVVHFLRNVGRLFEELPVLPEELDIVLLRPPNMEGDPHFQQQFARDFRVRRSCLLTWLHYLQRHHPGYRDIVVRQDRLQRLPLDGSIVASVASQVADIPNGEAPQGPIEEDIEEDPADADASAIPDLQVTDTELNALQSRLLHSTPDPERMADLEHIPPNAQAQHQMPLPSIRRTPINEFNRSQPLLTLAFPTLYPDGKADFVEPRLRSQDGRFARHKTWPFIALNTLLRAQVRKRSNYSVKQHKGRRRQPLTRANIEEAIAKPDEPEAQALIQSITRQAAELEACAYNLGRPGLFVTASAANYHWESLYPAPEAARMALSRQLLRDNAHIAAYHFHKRYTLFRTIILRQNGHPDLDPNDSQSRERFARIWGYHVSAVNPEPQRVQAPREGNPLISNLLEHPLTVQFLSIVVNRLSKHTKQVDQMNHYNRLLAVAWLANTDVSPCTSLQQVIDYAAKYCSKSEKKSESFAQIGKALMPRVKDHNPLISFTLKLLNQLVTERDYSKQEVSHLLLGLPLQEGSRTCLHIDCRNPDMHSRSLRIDADEWKQWQPANVNGRPRVLWPEYCRVKLALNHPHRRHNELLIFDGHRFNSHAQAFSYYWQHHSHSDDHYGRPKEVRLQPQEDQYEALPVEEEFNDED
ncbi:uncharacterized protein NECHADRAFT_98098 [Fusarium vanettenii 77-13-4]|uniref:Uncharacterized protein n=1 Tax=Fusarium vanettenii (strain ATCC MYA-4622 / CBS 123669 / FGSC 9596 / NRRL 45880 / 77-13-4) TaxID=660122 RepID=C7ZM83_FUSV7|nr:uncharacterized protein NECHADRAFT_98098 [Fusarium vanettenii 77-13-4]EEU34868.1 hypothetical protein NECHADRAFT_98098 [Fusarium vanettenii 77-13-4]